MRARLLPGVEARHARAHPAAGADRGATIEPLIDAHGDGRRRVTLHVRFPDRMHVGYMAPRSHQIVEIAFCPIAEPALKEQAPAIARAIGEHLKGPRKPLDIQITADADRLRRGRARSRPREGRGAPRPHRPRGGSRSRAPVDPRRRDRGAAPARHRQWDAPPSFRPPARSCRRRDSAKRRLRASCSRPARGQAASPTSFPARAPSRCGSRSSADVHAVETMKRSLAALDKAARATPGLRRVTHRGPRPLPPPASGAGARRVRCRGPRPAPRGRRGAGASNSPSRRYRSWSASPATRPPSRAMRQS